MGHDLPQCGIRTGCAGCDHLLATVGPALRDAPADRLCDCWFRASFSAVRNPLGCPQPPAVLDPTPRTVALRWVLGTDYQLLHVLNHRSFGAVDLAALDSRVRTGSPGWHHLLATAGAPVHYPSAHRLRVRRIWSGCAAARHLLGCAHCPPVHNPPSAGLPHHRVRAGCSASSDHLGRTHSPPVLDSTPDRLCVCRVRTGCAASSYLPAAARTSVLASASDRLHARWLRLPHSAPGHLLGRSQRSPVFDPASDRLCAPGLRPSGSEPLYGPAAPRPAIRGSASCSGARQRIEHRHHRFLRRADHHGRGLPGTALSHLLPATRSAVRSVAPDGLRHPGVRTTGRGPVLHPAVLGTTIRCTASRGLCDPRFRPGGSTSGRLLGCVDCPPVRDPSAPGLRLRGFWSGGADSRDHRGASRLPWGACQSRVASDRLRHPRVRPGGSTSSHLLGCADGPPVRGLAADRLPSRRIRSGSSIALYGPTFLGATVRSAPSNRLRHQGVRVPFTTPSCLQSAASSAVHDPPPDGLCARRLRPGCSSTVHSPTVPGSPERESPTHRLCDRWVWVPLSGPGHLLSPRGPAVFDSAPAGFHFARVWVPIAAGRALPTFRAPTERPSSTHRLRASWFRAGGSAAGCLHSTACSAVRDPPSRGLCDLRVRTGRTASCDSFGRAGGSAVRASPSARLGLRRLRTSRSTPSHFHWGSGSGRVATPNRLCDQGVRTGSPTPGDHSWNRSRLYPQPTM